jgi:hypothetical protein
MPSTTLLQLENTIAAALEFNIKGPALSQTIQEKPLLNALRKKQKTFSGGRGAITKNVKFDYTTTIQGFEDLDTVTYSNPRNIKKASFSWKEIHAGLTVPFSELKVAGIIVNDSATGESTSKLSGRDAHVITDLLADKLDDMNEGWARSMNDALWKDGTADPKLPAGIMALIKPASSNATGSTGGISRVTNALWRNRTATFTYTAGQSNLITGLQAEIRQLKRYGGKPDLIVCGSEFLGRLEREIHAKGLYTQVGFAKNTDITIGAPVILGVGEFLYDPTLDSLAKHDGTGNQSLNCYILDTKAIGLHVLEGDDMKVHNPARPEDKYAIYKGMTWSGALAAWRLNSSGLYTAADGA